MCVCTLDKTRRMICLHGMLCCVGIMHHDSRMFVSFYKSSTEVYFFKITLMQTQWWWCVFLTAIVLKVCCASIEETTETSDSESGSDGSKGTSSSEVHDQN